MVGFYGRADTTPSKTSALELGVDRRDPSGLANGLRCLHQVGAGDDGVTARALSGLGHFGTNEEDGQNVEQPPDSEDPVRRGRGDHSLRGRVSGRTRGSIARSSGADLLLETVDQLECTARISLSERALATTAMAPPALIHPRG